MKKDILAIPYRLETLEDITNALQGDLLGTTDYQRLLHCAKQTTLHKPLALIKSKKKVSKEFIKVEVDEKKIRDVKINFSQVANLPLIPQYQKISESIPWIDDIICHQNLFHFFHSFPLEIRKRFLLELLPESPMPMYSAVLNIRRFLKRELVVYVKAHKTSSLSLIQLKRSLVALTVFEPSNEDVLVALKTGEPGEDNPLHQNAIAEILFARLPQTIQRLLTRNSNNLAQRLSLKMIRLNLSPRHIMNLMGYVKQNMTSDDLYKALNRIDGVAMKMSIPGETKKRLHDYMESMKNNMNRAPLVYRTLFLTPELEIYQKLYQPTKVMQSTETLIERTVRRYTKPTILDFYATKDFFDLIKARFSDDCTDTYLGEKQLMTPFFFNIRIFKGQKWIGNIYMLDFCEGHDSLIIDRIQIPRERKALYHQFFDCLKEVLIEMFDDTRYQYIFMPLKISNHAAIQNIFNEYKNQLKKKTMLVESPFTDRFESLDGKKSYYILHKRPQG